MRTLEFELRFAELALESGDAAAALDRFTSVHEQAAILGVAYAAEQYEALYGMSRANEMLGELRTALRGFEDLASTPDLPSSINRTSLKVWLCRAYLQLGDIARAIDLGETALAEVGAGGSVFVSDEATELAATLVLAYCERGDLARAELLIEHAVTAAEAGGSLRARAAAYWNAAVVAEAQGELRAALRMAERALAFFGEIGNAWAVASLRANSGAFLLRLPEPRLEEAAALLRQGLDELLHVGSPADMAAAETEMARCLLMSGKVDAAMDTARAAVGRVEDGPRLEKARAQAVLAAALLASDREQDAVASYAAAAAALEEDGARRQAAPVWRELARLLAAMGREADALAAYERMATALGVPAVPTHPAATPEWR